MQFQISHDDDGQGDAIAARGDKLEPSSVTGTPGNGNHVPQLPSLVARNMSSSRPSSSSTSGRVEKLGDAVEGLTRAFMMLVKEKGGL